MYSVGSRGRWLIALLIGILTLPIVGMTVYFTYDVQQRISFARGERRGLTEVDMLGTLLSDTSQYAGAIACRLPKNRVNAARTRADVDFRRIDREFTPATMPERWNEVRTAWKALRVHATPSSNFSRLFDPLTWSYGRLSDDSGLTFDPGLQGIDISDSLTYRLPRAIEAFSLAQRELCTSGAVPSMRDRLQLQSDVARGRQLTADAFQDIDDALGHGEEGSMPELQQAYRTAKNAQANAMSSINAFVTSPSPQLRERSAHALDEFTSALLALMRAEGPAADRVVAGRINTFGKERFITVIPGILGLLVSLLVAWLVLRLLWERAALQTAERAAAEHERIAMHDSLTGLLNRRAFFTALANASTNGEEHGVLCLLDIDDFKGVNDTYGHLTGDDVLVRLAGIIEASVRSTDVVARIGGDEFAMFLRSPIDRNGVERVLGIITRDASAQAFIRQKTFCSSVSIGAAFVRDVSKDSVEDAIARADFALYKAKAEKRGKYVIFESDTTK